MSDSDSDYVSDDGERWDGWDENNTESSAPIQDLVAPENTHASASAFFSATKAAYGIDILAYFAEEKLDLYDRMRAINTLRRTAAGGSVAPAALLTHLKTTTAAWRGTDDALLPAVEADALLQWLVEVGHGADYDDSDDDADADPADGGNAYGKDTTTVPEPAEEERAETAPARALGASVHDSRALRQQVDELREVVARMTATLQDFAQHAAVNADGAAAGTSAAGAASVASLGERLPGVPRDDLKANDASYFSGYSQRGIHEVMLKDKIRTESYRDAMLARAEELFKDKVVLDVGCGSGILTMFAARAGAKLCIGVDAADIIDKTRTIVATNGLADRVKLVKGKVEEVTLPAGAEAVDIIVSEWMGYFLLYESMLPSVLYARDKWLRRKDGRSAYQHCLDRAGVTPAAYATTPASVYSAAESYTNEIEFATGSFLFPDSSRMFVAGVDTRALRADRQCFWRDVYGFDMSALMTPDEAFPGESVDVLEAGDACRVTDECGLQAFDLQTVASAQLDFVSHVTLTATKDDAVEAFAVWFDTVFSSAARRPSGAAPASPVHRGPAPGEGDFASAAAVRALDGSVVLDTAFSEPPTHWKQSVFRLSRVCSVRAGDKIELVLKATRRSTNHRHYNVEVFYTLRPAAGGAAAAKPAGKPDPLNTEWAEPNVEYQQMYSLQ